LKNFLNINPENKKATRAAFGETLVRIGETHPNVVVLDADLSVSTKSGAFAKKFPARFFQMGIAEANMIGTAAGLALSGKIPFLCSFGCFITGRFETIRISIGYNQANVRMIGTHAGLGIGEDGYTQMALEDMALMRSLPGMGVLQPADPKETEKMIEYLAEHHRGPVYVRLTRQNVAQLFGDDYEFHYGQGVILKEGKDLALLATGGVVYHSYLAAELLDREGISTTVVNIHTIKPLDESLVLELSKTHKKLVTVEDHNIIGGLGTAVAEVLASSGGGAKLLRLGVHDVYGESGSAEALYEKYGLSGDKIFHEGLRFYQS
jgi:transketolase